MDDPKIFGAFINGVIRRSFYGYFNSSIINHSGAVLKCNFQHRDSSITLALLKEELFQQSNVSDHGKQSVKPF
jgi:hypothetical protein